MFVNTTYEIALNATNGFIESNAVGRPDADDAAVLGRLARRRRGRRCRGGHPRETECDETEQPASGHAISCSTGRRPGRVAPERGGYALGATRAAPGRAKLLPCVQTREAHGRLGGAGSQACAG